MKKLKASMRSDLTLTILVFFTIAILVFLAITLGPKVYNGRNFQSMAFQISEFAVLAFGMGLAMLLGGIDLSIVANANLSGIMCAFVLSNAAIVASLGDGATIAIAVIVALVVGTVGGLFNGFLIAKCSVHPIVATLGTMTLYNGISTASTGGNGVSGFPKAFTNLGVATVSGVPVLFIIFMVLAIIVIFVMTYTGFGKKIYMIGENHTAARFSAINNEKCIMIIYAMAGFLAGVSGIMISARVNSSKVGYGDTYQLQAILVAVLAGISPSGGKGKMAGILLALACTQILQSAFTVWQFTPYSKKLIWGVMLLAMLFVNKIIDYLDTQKQKQLLDLQLAQDAE
ncbi:MAG: ABC transporter permease [Lachnospiraceae bacterium]|nr:ABC transporter permease [Candidatus Equihabitans merdae]